MSGLPEDYLKYPNRKYGQDHDFYEWRLSSDRTKLKWDGGAKVAICFIVPLEFFPLNPSGVPFKHPGAMVTPYPDLRYFTVRDYGNRVGVYRILEGLADADVKATFAMNGEIFKRNSPLTQMIDKHEIALHGISTDHIHHEGLTLEEERSLISNSKHLADLRLQLNSDIPKTRMKLLEGSGAFVPRNGDIVMGDQGYSSPDGKPMGTCYAFGHNNETEWQLEVFDTEVETIPYKGWLSPARNQSSRTMSLLAAADIKYCLDWEMDQIPVMAKTDYGDITLIPNNYELSDFTLLHIRRQTEEAWLKQITSAIDLLVEEHEQFGSQMLGLTLTPYIIGQPFRVWALRELLSQINARDDVSVFTVGSIDQQFRAQI